MTSASRASEKKDGVAEREGFEPSIGVTYTPLAGARLQPLGHLSAAAQSTESRPDRESEFAQLPGLARFSKHARAEGTGSA